jgi:hypothetical protein
LQPRLLGTYIYVSPLSSLPGRRRAGERISSKMRLIEIEKNKLKAIRGSGPYLIITCIYQARLTLDCGNSKREQKEKFKIPRGE